MKTFLRKSLAYLVPLLLVVVFVNISIDPANIYSDTEDRIAEYVSQGWNVTFDGNLDERSLHRAMISRLQSTPHPVILGSSRIMLLGEKELGPGTFNNGVSGASLEDLIGLYQVYVDHGRTPKYVVIGIDPWMFNARNEQDRWEVLQKEYSTFMGTRSPWDLDLPLSLVTQALSLSYFQESVKQGARDFLSGTPPRIPKPTRSDTNDVFTRRSDGSIFYDRKYRSVTPTQVNRRAKEFISGPVYSLEHFSAMDTHLLEVFTRFLATIRARTPRVELVLMPYHPLVYQHLRTDKKYAMVSKLEDFLYRYAKEADLPLTGSYDPSRFGLTSEHFYDGMHLTPEGMHIVLGSLRVPTDSLSREALRK